MFELILVECKLDQDPDPAENGPDPQPWKGTIARYLNGTINQSLGQISKT